MGASFCLVVIYFVLIIALPKAAQHYHIPSFSNSFKIKNSNSCSRERGHTKGSVTFCISFSLTYVNLTTIINFEIKISNSICREGGTKKILACIRSFNSFFLNKFQNREGDTERDLSTV
jgi:hypothetical protein